jgi:hypothetical protein
VRVTSEQIIRWLLVAILVIVLVVLLFRVV